MKSVFITGAATGMGKAYADLLAAKGWMVFAGVLPSNPEVKEWKKNPKIEAVECDVTNPEQIAKARDYVAAHTGGSLDLLINNAGAGLACGPVEAAFMDNARITMEVNYWGIINMVQGFVSLLKRSRGRIINVSSPACYLTMPLGFAYCTTKTAAKSLSAHIRIELEPFGIDVTNLEPGGVESQMIMDGRDSSQTWDAMPKHLRDAYHSQFVSGLEGVSSMVKFIPPNEFAELVYKQVICQKKFKPNYQVGPGSKTMARLHRFLSDSMNEKIWKKVFKRQPA